MGYVRLEAAGFLMDAQSPAAQDETSLEREALLVYVGTFQSMDGEVGVTTEHIEKLMGTHNEALGRQQRLSTGEVHPKFFPPIQLDHSPLATHTVGRLKGELSIRDTDIGTGEKVPGLYGRVNILGRENVEKVNDGRWTHLSIGADLATGKLNELTITPFPAAANASLLAARKNSRLAEEKKVDKEKLKKHLMDKTKCSAEEADKKLSEMDDEKLKHLAKEADDDEKKLAAEKEAADKLAADKAKEDERLAAEEKKKGDEAKMTAARATFVKLAKDTKVQLKESRLTAKKVDLSIRLSVLRASAKITPAEIKKIDVAELAGKSDETVDTFFKGFELREPVIQVGQMGSSNAIPLTKLAKVAANKKQFKETLSHMPFTGKALSAKLAKEEEEDKKSGADRGDKHLAATDVDTATAFNEVLALIDAGNRDQALAKLKEFMNSMGASTDMAHEMDDDSQKRMAALAGDVKKLQNSFEDLVKSVGPALGVDASELEN